MSSKSDNTPLFTGSCFCKAVHLRISSLPTAAYICHCHDCRRFCGSSFAHNACFPKSSLNITFSTPKGAAFASPPTTPAETGVKDRSYDVTDPSEAANGKDVLSSFGTAETGQTKFCSICGVRVLLTCGSGNVQMRETVIVPVGVIDGSETDERLAPTFENYCRRREIWMPQMKGTKEID
jgi:hypothetical protein